MAGKHTPGPWTIQPVDKRCGPDINITGPDPYANVKGDHSYRYYVGIVKATDRDDTTAGTAGGWVYPRVEQAEANARLIKAAPDMLTLLWKLKPIIHAENEVRKHCAWTAGNDSLLAFRAETNMLLVELRQILEDIHG